MADWMRKADKMNGEFDHFSYCPLCRRRLCKKETANKPVEPTAEGISLCNCGPGSHNGLNDDCPVHG